MGEDGGAKMQLRVEGRLYTAGMELAGDEGRQDWWEMREGKGR